MAHCFIRVVFLQNPSISEQIGNLSTKIALLCDSVHILARNSETWLLNLFVVKHCTRVAQYETQRALLKLQSLLCTSLICAYAFFLQN